MTVFHDTAPSSFGTTIPNHLGQALAEKLDRLTRRWLARQANQSNDRIGSPGFAELTPDLTGETGRT